LKNRHCSLHPSYPLCALSILLSRQAGAGQYDIHHIHLETKDAKRQYHHGEGHKSLVGNVAAVRHEHVRDNRRNPACMPSARRSDGVGSKRLVDIDIIDMMINGGNMVPKM
jgi:hypothetical protein